MTIITNMTQDYFANCYRKGLGVLLVGFFRGQKGQDMVQRQAYALEESATGKDLRTDIPLPQCLRRGMRISMSMIFERSELIVGACPRCRAITNAPEGVDIQWYVKLPTTSWRAP